MKFFFKRKNLPRIRRLPLHLHAPTLAVTPLNPAAAQDPVVTAPAVAADTIDDIVLALGQAGFKAHLNGDLGGVKNGRDALRVVKNTARFLMWTHNNVHNLPLSAAATLAWFETIILRHYIEIVAYAQHCIKALSFAPSTMRNHIGDILTAANWYSIYATAPGHLPAEALVKLTHVAKAVRTSQTKREKHTRARVTMDSKIRERLMPTGGLPELQRAVTKKLPWVHTVNIKAIRKDEYRVFMGLLYSALYVFMAQGRIGGIMDLDVHQATELLTCGHVTTDQFKTNEKWGLQPVTLGAQAFGLLKLYLEEVRPQVGCGNGEKRSVRSIL